MGAKKGSTIPIIDHHHLQDPIVAAHYANPLTQILMLTAIVVGVATLGLGLALARKVYEQFQTFNEDEILDFACKKGANENAIKSLIELSNKYENFLTNLKHRENSLSVFSKGTPKGGMPFSSISSSIGRSSPTNSPSGCNI